MPTHVRKGDTVIIRSGSEKGRTGVVLRVHPQDQLVTVQGINLKTKVIKPSRNAPQGAVVSREAPLHWSKVSPVVDGKPVRVRFVTKPDGSKVRVAAKRGVEARELGVVRRATADRRSKKVS